MNTSDLDLDRLLKLRLAVARCGEMDCARLWNTDGQLGPSGATFLRRGFPRTHHFAQARSVFAAAAARCAEVFPMTDAITLWWLGEDIEEAFDLQWEVWLDAAIDWRAHFEALARSRSPDLIERLTEGGLVAVDQITAVKALAIDPGGRAVRVSEAFDGGADAISRLAIGFARGAPGQLVVPYARRAG